MSSFSGSLVSTPKVLLISPSKADVSIVTAKLPLSPGFISAELAEIVVASGQDR